MAGSGLVSSTGAFFTRRRRRMLQMNSGYRGLRLRLCSLLQNWLRPPKPVCAYSLGRLSQTVQLGDDKSCHCMSLLYAHSSVQDTYPLSLLGPAGGHRSVCGSVGHCSTNAQPLMRVGTLRMSLGALPRSVPDKAKPHLACTTFSLITHTRRPFMYPTLLGPLCSLTVGTLTTF